MPVTSSGVTYELPDGFNAPPVIVFGPTYPNWNLVTALYDAFASSNQTAHDMAVYAVRREYNPSDSKQVWSAVEIMMRKMGGRLDGVELDLDSLVPFKPDEYEAYVAAGNPRSEVVAASIAARKNAEFEARIPTGTTELLRGMYVSGKFELPWYTRTYIPKYAPTEEALKQLMYDISGVRANIVTDMKPKPSKMEKIEEGLKPRSLAREWKDDFIQSPILTIVITLIVLYGLICTLTSC